MSGVPLTIGGYREGDPVGIGRVTAPNHVRREDITKPVTIDANGNNRADPGEQTLLVSVRRSDIPRSLPLWDAKGNQAERGDRLLKLAGASAAVGASSVMWSLVPATAASLIRESWGAPVLYGSWAIGGAALVAGAGLAIAGGVIKHRAAQAEEAALQQHVRSQIPDLVPLRQ